MGYLFALQMPGKEIVLGEFEGEEKDKVLKKISTLIESGAFSPEKETQPFFIARYLYGSELQVIKSEIALLEIKTDNGQVSLPEGWSFKEKAKAPLSITAK